MMAIKKCDQCGLDYMYSNIDARFKEVCQDCFSKNEQKLKVKSETKKRKKEKTKGQVEKRQKQCLECNLWFYPKSSYQQVCDDDCRDVRKKRMRHIYFKQRQKFPIEILKKYKARTKRRFKQLDETKLFKFANQAVIQLELIDELLTKKFGTSLDLLMEKNEGN